MSKKLWTEHKLSDHQLTRLSQMVNGRRHRHGVALLALVNKGLARENEEWTYYGDSHVATPAGAAALAQARKEGW